MRTGTRRQLTLVVSDSDILALTEKMTMPFKVACYLMYYCGLRISETHKLVWNDIDFDNSTILVRKSKNLITRDAILHREVRQLLEHIIALEHPTPRTRVVPVREASSIYSAVKRHALEIGKPYVHPHSLRHSYATNLVESGIPITDVKELLGHANIETTSRYVHPTIEGIKKKYAEKGWI